MTWHLLIGENLWLIIFKILIHIHVDRKTKYKVVNYVILGYELYKRSMNGLLLKCLRESETYIALAKTYDEICGSQQASERWSGCYFDKVIIGQLFWRIALIMQNHVKNAKNMVPYNKFQQVSYIRWQNLGLFEDGLWIW